MKDQALVLFKLFFPLAGWNICIIEAWTHQKSQTQRRLFLPCKHIIVLFESFLVNPKHCLFLFLKPNESLGRWGLHLIKLAQALPVRIKNDELRIGRSQVSVSIAIVWREIPLLRNGVFDMTFKTPCKD